MTTSFRSSQRLKDKLEEFEGCRLEAYKCAGNVWTIGIGHTKDVRRGDRISRQMALEYLSDDLKMFEKGVNALGVCETLGQFDALVSFAFNLGLAALRESTLLKLIREGAAEEVIRAEFSRWVYCRGVKLGGLVKRRAWEANRFFEKW